MLFILLNAWSCRMSSSMMTVYLFRNASGICRKYACVVCPLKLPPMKYIILSATLNHDVYREYFRGKMEVYRYREKKAAYKGKLRQYTYQLVILVYAVRCPDHGQVLAAQAVEPCAVAEMDACRIQPPDISPTGGFRRGQIWTAEGRRHQ